MNLFKSYPNEVFIETGTLDGFGVDRAIEAGFKRIYSIEACPSIHERNRLRFISYPHVSIILGRSEVELPKLVSDLMIPATVWLDAHGSWEAPMLPGSSMCPLREELEALANAPCRKHTVLIDDVSDFIVMGFSVEILTEMLRRVNPSYSVAIVDNDRPQSVLAAWL